MKKFRKDYEAELTDFIGRADDKNLELLYHAMVGIKNAKPYQWENIMRFAEGYLKADIITQ